MDILKINLVQEYVDENYIDPMNVPKFSMIIDPNRLKNLSERLESPRDSFAVLLQKKIRELGMYDPAVYNKAHISRQLFNKVINDGDYNPSKRTVICLICALELDIETANEFLSRAGYSLSKSKKFDLIILYCIENKIYDIDDINQILEYFDIQMLFE